MKAKILDLNGKNIKDINLPIQFSEEYRPDLIKRAVLTIQLNKRQSYGAKPEAGKRVSAKLSRRRRNFKGAYGYGISRVPRKTISRRGTRFIWVGAFAPGTVKGRRAHPPKAGKNLIKKLNKKERLKAVRSAISATINNELVKNRGHSFKELPLVLESKFESLSKTKEIKDVLIKIGLGDELNRISKKKIRAGKGKLRGRKYKSKKGPLIVVSEKCNLLNFGRNINGIDIIDVNSLNAELLAPGCNAGRLVVWSNNAIEKMGKEELFC